MNKPLARLALLVAAAAPLPVTAQNAPHAKPAAQKVTATTKDVGPLEYVLPEVNFTGIALGDVVDFLRDVVPNFKVVIVRPAGATPADDPPVSLRLRQASLGQLLQVITRAYPVEMSTVPPSLPSDREVTILTVKPPAHQAPAGAAGVGVRVYNVASITQALLGSRGIAATQPAAVASALKGALNDVLSLCEAALKQVPNAQPAALQVHEPTQTLIFKGTPEQQAALEDVLNALDPYRGAPERAVVREHGEQTAAKEAEIRAQAEQAMQREHEAMQAQMQQATRNAEERLVELRERMAELQSRLAKQQAEAIQQERETERLKIRLEAAERAAAAAANPPADSKGKESRQKE